MDRTLEYERVSIIEARLSFESDYRVPTREERGARPAPLQAVGLEGAALDWLAGLPDDIRPANLAARYPRIVNEFAQRWRKVARCEEYFDELLFDHRGGRMGFSRDLGRELTKLRDHYAYLHPERHSVWQFVA